MDAIDDQVWWSVIGIIFVVFILVRIHETSIQSATLLIGKAIAPSSMPGLSKTNGLQDGLTYDYQKFRQVLSIALCFGFIFFGALIAWYIGPVVIAVGVIVSAVLSRGFQKPVLFYVGRMIEGVQRRRAKYVRLSDHGRAEACDWFEGQLTEIYEHLLHLDPELKMPAFSMIHGSSPKELRAWLSLEGPLF